jgi:phenylalanyl-tRNA synthetase alpha chain
MARFTLALTFFCMGRTGFTRRMQTVLAPTSLGEAIVPPISRTNAVRSQMPSMSSRSNQNVAPLQDVQPAAKIVGEDLPRTRSPQMVSTLEKQSRFINDNVGNNIPPSIINYIGRDLHLNPNHPLGIIKKKIEDYFNSLDGPNFEAVDALDPLVKAQACFDDLLIPVDHPGRAMGDTYYVTRDGGKELASSSDTLLRTHTSAHQSELLRGGKERFLCTGDVYRRDEIDRSHFPVFHQMEGVKLFDPDAVGGEMTREEWLESPGCKAISDDLKKTLEGLCDVLFGPVEKRWIDEYFPFTEPSFELEIFYNGDWMEVLGSGVIHTGVLQNAGLSGRHGWAFGLGLERLAMVLFEVPDIRLFWSEDERWTKQFKEGEITKFKPFSKYPPCEKDISFWIPEGFEENDFFEVARSTAGELVEEINCFDKFTNPKTNRTSHAYRVTYRSLERTLDNEEINKLLFDLVDMSEKKLGIEVRQR